MFCPFCGARFTDSEPACNSCGAERASEGPSPTEAAPVTTAGPVETAELLPPPLAPLSAEASALEGARCIRHPRVNATFVCARCGSFCCGPCASQNVGSEGTCIRCERPGLALASRGTRFMANLVDQFAVAGPIFLGGIVVGIAGLKTEGHSLSEPAYVLAGLAMVITIGVQIAAQVTWGQSLGKRLLKIRVVRTDGSPVELWRILVLRNLVPIVLSRFCALLSLADILAIFGQDQRCLHDRFADTIVVDQAPQ